MSICGFNDRIGEGLEALIDGLAVALERKALVNSVAQVLDREMVELDAMIRVLSEESQETLPGMFIGLNILARALFKQVQSNLQASGSEDLGGECRKVGAAFIRLLADTEERNEAQHEAHPKSPAAELAEELAKWALDASASRERQAKIGVAPAKLEAVH